VLTVDHLGCLGEVAGACIGQVTGMWKVVAFPFLARCTLANAGPRWLRTLHDQAVETTGLVSMLAGSRSRSVIP
jgi:hypothetical protein